MWLRSRGDMSSYAAYARGALPLLPRRFLVLAVNKINKRDFLIDTKETRRVVAGDQRRPTTTRDGGPAFSLSSFAQKPTTFTVIRYHPRENFARTCINVTRTKPRADLTAFFGGNAHFFALFFFRARAGDSSFC